MRHALRDSAGLVGILARAPRSSGTPARWTGAGAHRIRIRIRNPDRSALARESEATNAGRGGITEPDGALPISVTSRLAAPESERRST